jgi:glutathione S-transferase kappa 1
MNADLARSAKRFNIPLQFPKQFPYSSLTAQRLLTYVSVNYADKLAECTRAIWICYWSKGNVPSAENIAAQLSSTMGAEFAKSIPAFVSDVAVKEKLTAATNEAQELGAFGMPWIKVEFDGKTEVT